MLDRDIRNYLYQNDLHHYTEDAESRVIDEMGLSAHAARIDIGVVNGQLVGYEIKSDRDNLDRLPRQMAVYSQIFDLVTVVCGPKHEKKLEEWLAVEYAHCGLWVTQRTNGCDELRRVRPATQNPNRNGYMIASLLWHEEAKQLLVELGLSKGLSRLRRWELWERLAMHFADIDDLADRVRAILKARTTWREA
jgi:hypothetical protein